MVSRLVLLGNVASPHVRQWVELLISEWPILIHGLDESPPLLNESSRLRVSSPIKGALRWAPKIVRYVALGFWMRFFAGSAHFIHAHNTSGYGLSALLSGKKYVVTTYGTEIFGAQKRSALYRFIIRLILRRARAVTATSEEMKQSLIMNFSVPEQKIFTFSLGVSAIFLDPRATNKRGTSPVWLCNRRIHPLYNTLTLVEAFEEYLKVNRTGVLILLAGDADANYKAKVLERVAGNPNIVVINEFLGQQELVEMLDAVHFTVSIPDSDQLSSSILEGAARGAVPIIRGLKSYASISEISICLPALLTCADLAEAFFESANILDRGWLERSEKAKNFVRSRYSMQQMNAEYRRILQKIDGPSDLD